MGMIGSRAISEVGDGPGAEVAGDEPIIQVAAPMCSCRREIQESNGLSRRVTDPAAHDPGLRLFSGTDRE